MTDDVKLAELASALRHLAEDADSQRSYLAELGVPGHADELALEFDDAYIPARHLLAGSHEALTLCDELDAALSDDSLSWDAGNLDDAQWGAIRVIASRALGQLGGGRGSVGID